MTFFAMCIWTPCATCECSGFIYITVKLLRQRPSPLAEAVRDDNASPSSKSMSPSWYTLFLICTMLVLMYSFSGLFSSTSSSSSSSTFLICWMLSLTNIFRRAFSSANFVRLRCWLRILIPSPISDWPVTCIGDWSEETFLLILIFGINIKKRMQQDVTNIMPVKTKKTEYWKNQEATGNV